jgi:membrane peptidoglycan carboxypeptidase
VANWSPSPIWPQTPRRRRGVWNYPRPHRTGLRAWIPSWRFVVGTVLTGLSLVVGVFTAGWIGWPIPPENGEIGSESTTVYYANGQVMGKFAAVDRTIRTLDELPPHIPAAVLASEDQNFENHMGVDPAGMVRAFVSNVTGGTRQGASTLTQQYVENTYYQPGQSSYADKFREIILAVKVEQEKSKDEILEGYINSIYLGRGAYGFEAAAKAYFNKPAAELTVSETAMLVGIIPSPSYWDPRFGEESRAIAEVKWARVLRNMADAGVITTEEQKSAKFPEPIKYKQVSRAGQVGYLLEEVRKELADEAGLTEDDLMTYGYEIHTTINPKWQKAAVETANSIPRKGEGAASPRLAVSIVSVDPKDGAIRALYGGRDYAEVQFNSATDGKAQPGSTFKPFTLIGAPEDGHELNEYYPGNSPMQIPGWVKEEGGPEVELTNFGPEGSGGESFGDIDLIDATAHSVNTVYAQLNVKITPQKSQDVAIRAGIPKESTNDTLSNVLGTEPVHAVDLAGAYATFAAQGTRTEPHIVTSVKNGEKLIHEWEGVPQQGVISPEVMTKANYALQQVVNEGRQDRVDQREPGGVVRRVHPAAHDGGGSLPDGRGRRQPGQDHSVRRVGRGRHHRWYVAGHGMDPVHAEGDGGHGGRRVPRLRAAGPSDAHPVADPDSDAHAGRDGADPDQPSRATGRGCHVVAVRQWADPRRGPGRERSGAGDRAQRAARGSRGEAGHGHQDRGLDRPCRGGDGVRAGRPGRRGREQRQT